MTKTKQKTKNKQKTKKTNLSTAMFVIAVVWGNFAHEDISHQLAGNRPSNVNHHLFGVGNKRGVLLRNASVQQVADDGDHIFIRSFPRDRKKKKKKKKKKRRSEFLLPYAKWKRREMHLPIAAEFDPERLDFLDILISVFDSQEEETV